VEIKKRTVGEKLQKIYFWNVNQLRIDKITLIVNKNTGM
jgi:hypothetical protein